VTAAPRLTRRRALMLAASAAAPVVLGAAPAAAEPQVSGDAAVLTPLRRAEAAAEVAYRTVAAAGGPDDVVGLANGFAAHEREHAMALATALEALGADKPEPPRSATELDRTLAVLGVRPLSAADGPRARLTVLLELEEALIARWVRAHRGLQDPNLMRTATQVLACQGQHAVALRAALGEDLLPSSIAADR
jgi:hypothetical protein